MAPSPRRLPFPFWGQLLEPWVGATIFIAWYLWQAPTQWQYDSMELYHGCRAIVDWWQGVTPTIGQTRQFPLFQYLTGTPVIWLARRGILINISTVWSACSLLSLAGTIIVFHLAARALDRPTLGWAAMVILLGGPMLMYARSTFNELPAAFLIVCFTWAVTGRARPLACASLFWLAGITKETAPAMLAIVWLGAMWMQRSQRSCRWFVVQALTLLLAFGGTFATNAAFNFARFGAIWNLNYLQPHQLIHAWSWRLQYVIAQWIAPSTGVAVFWPTLTIVVFATISIALLERRSPAPAILVLIMLGALTLGLSGWYGPFGWACWGPRLMLPWLPACLLLLLRGYSESLAQFVNRCTANPRSLLITSIVVCLCALPHVMAAEEPDVIGLFFANDARFPQGASALQPAQKYAQNLYLAWQKSPPLLARPMLFHVTPLSVIGAGCFLLALLGLLRKCRWTIVRRTAGV